MGVNGHRESWSLSREEEGLSSKSCQIHRMMPRGTQVTTEPGDLQKGWNTGLHQELGAGSEARGGMAG